MATMQKAGSVAEVLIDGSYHYLQLVGSYWQFDADVVAVLDASPTEPLTDDELDQLLRRAPRFVDATFFDDIIAEPCFQRMRRADRFVVPEGTGPDPGVPPPGLEHLHGDDPGVSTVGMFLNMVSTGYARGSEAAWYQRNRELAAPRELPSEEDFWAQHIFEVPTEAGAEGIAERLRAAGYEADVVHVPGIPDEPAPLDVECWFVQAPALQRDGSDLDEDAVRRFAAGYGEGGEYRLDVDFVLRA
jgi:hypothetical protein